MPLRHFARKTVLVDLDACKECLLRPDKFLAHSRYTYAAKRLDDGTYEVVFRWVKWGMERFYKVRLRIRQENGVVAYESTPDSEYPFRLEFRLQPGSSRTSVEVEAEMGAGLMASLLGRKDFREFIEELVEKGIVGAARELVRREGREPTGAVAPACSSCILYDPERRYCYALRSSVEDPAKPPCRGRYYLPAPSTV